MVLLVIGTTEAFMTIESLKEQLDALRALKSEFQKVRDELDETSDRARAEFLRTEEYPRLKNLIYDASLDFSAVFFAAFGVGTGNLNEATRPHGYMISKKYPIRDRD
jgi:hypothetical protein